MSNKTSTLGIIPSLIIAIVVPIFVLSLCSKGKSNSESKEDMNYFETCGQMIKGKVNYPASVKYSYYSSSVYHAPNGNIAVTIAFTAKNGFGNDMDHKARCIFEPNGVSEISIV